MKKLYRCPICKKESHEKNSHTSEFIGLVSEKHVLRAYEEIMEKVKDLDQKTEGGLKFDDSKARWDLLPLETIEEVVQVLTHGAKKYQPNNWQKVDKDRYFAALMRHLKAYQAGKENDQESGLHHLAHAMTNVLFLLWKARNDK